MQRKGVKNGIYKVFFCISLKKVFSVQIQFQECCYFMILIILSKNQEMNQVCKMIMVLKKYRKRRIQNSLLKELIVIKFVQYQKQKMHLCTIYFFLKFIALAIYMKDTMAFLLWKNTQSF
ncbi:transmembrane protein, putative (macronuclear) [Tetrahymena thermophila SB210]|uniref:Transmembrane protein, putative n=1 Tax=Tetrahymena thermophila (strain SB210) TaxID=312017 RepID=W7XFN3_TETTS|nr:transmembrane protein, putative [Tetrahymena thermophila SB210]EWS76677.1 transmembrane protein, putative [Tetrahymena thermophila SB210]|eukprot:XP_012650845.1 transmembrane protein, putative [Tetrahymena thermophila SB210]